MTTGLKLIDTRRWALVNKLDLKIIFGNFRQTLLHVSESNKFIGQ